MSDLQRELDRAIAGLEDDRDSLQDFMHWLAGFERRLDDAADPILSHVTGAIWHTLISWEHGYTSSQDARSEIAAARRAGRRLPQGATLD